MPTTSCKISGSIIPWNWEEAFDKFGFGDGDGQVMTHTVAIVLQRAGYSVEHHTWGLHNDIITSIKHKGVELIPDTANVGYHDPRVYLPEAIVTLLDRELSEHEEVSL